MTEQQLADHLLQVWQSRRHLPPAFRLPPQYQRPANENDADAAYVDRLANVGRIVEDA